MNSESTLQKKRILHKEKKYMYFTVPWSRRWSGGADTRGGGRWGFNVGLWREANVYVGEAFGLVLVVGEKLQYSALTFFSSLSGELECALYFVHLWRRCKRKILKRY